MGLDMILTGRKYFWRNYDNRASERREDDKRVTSMDVELAYWRKHPDLHGYMVKTFAEGRDDCKEIELSADDLRRIIAAVKAYELPKTTGFFFGESDGTQAEAERDAAIFQAALDWLEATDPDPFETEKTFDGPNFSATIVKRKPDAELKRQRVSRSVHYRGDW